MKTYLREDRTFWFLYIYSTKEINSEIGHLQRPRKDHFLSSFFLSAFILNCLFHSHDSQIKQNLLLR